MSRRKKPRYKRGDIVEQWDFHEANEVEKHYLLVVSVTESHYMYKLQKKKHLLYKMWDIGGNHDVTVDVSIADMVGWGRWERHCWEVFFPFRETTLDNTSKEQ